MPKTETSPLLDIEFYIKAAEQHGEDSEPDHEVGDLQDFLREAWKIMTPEQRLNFAKNSDVHATLEGALVDVDTLIESLPE